MDFIEQDPGSILFITLDSCRYDTFLAATVPNLKSVGELYRAMAPGNFTYSSHAAMFEGFTPGIAQRAEPFVNPKYSKIFKMQGPASKGKSPEFISLHGRNIVDGLKRRGFLTIGSGAVGWFNPNTETGLHLTEDFDHFFYAGGRSAPIRDQLAWLGSYLKSAGRPVFVFLNIGETHVPYYFEGASWGRDTNPCVPFGKENSAEECRRRQRACIEYVDEKLSPLVRAFQNATTLVCSDHGDCWGEDGLWEHGFYHEKVLEVPLLFRLARTDQEK